MTRNTAEISHFVYTFKIWQRNLLSGSTFKTKQLSSSKQEIANKMKVKSWWPWFFEASKKRDKSKFEHQRHVLRKTSLIWYIFYFIWRRHQIILLIHGFVDGLQNLLQKFFVEILYYAKAWVEGCRPIKIERKCPQPTKKYLFFNFEALPSPTMWARPPATPNFFIPIWTYQTTIVSGQKHSVRGFDVS